MRDRPGPASRRRAVPCTWRASAAGFRTTPAAPTPATPGPWPPSGRGRVRRAHSGGSAPWAAAPQPPTAASKLPNRTDMLKDSGRSLSRATHVTRRPISSQVPSMNRPPGASRPWTSRQIPSTSASSYWRSTLKARTRTGRPGTGSSKPPTWKLRPGCSRALASADPLGFDLDPAHADVRPDSAQALKKFDGGGRRCAVAQVDDQGIRRPAQAPGLRAGQPAVHPPHPVGVGGAAGNVAHRFAAALFLPDICGAATRSAF